MPLFWRADANTQGKCMQKSRGQDMQQQEEVYIICNMPIYLGAYGKCSPDECSLRKRGNTSRGGGGELSSIVYLWQVFV